jgi:AraC family transcriptional activator FtrA
MASVDVQTVDVSQPCGGMAVCSTADNRGCQAADCAVVQFPARTHEVVVLALPGAIPFDVAAVGQVMSPESHEWSSGYRVRVCSDDVDELRTADGYALRVDAGLHLLRAADTIVIAGVQDPGSEVSTAVVAALRERSAAGTRMVGIGTGVFVLARAGVLTGRRVTTHWHFAEKLRRAFPRVRVEADALFVQDGTVFTAAGLAAGIDLYLELIRQDHGVEAANLAARYTVMGSPRSGDQNQFVERPLPLRPDTGLAKVRAWMLQHLAEPMTVDALAARGYMSRRQFTRVFRAETGTSAWQWLLTERLREAKRLLESTEEPVEHIGELCGFPTPASFRMHFRRTNGTSPSAYRARVRSTSLLQQAS